MATTLRKLFWLTLFAIAMAQVEAAIVVHLRTIYYPADPLLVFPLELLSNRDLVIELIRELATVVMILSVAVLAERGFVRVFAAFVFIFGMWDIFYYIWLKLMIGWPVAWLEWDVLFLIPWPWVGPWLTPALIALLFCIWGYCVLASTATYRFTPMTILLFVAGALLALAAFLSPTAPLLAGGKAAFIDYTPGNFPWWLYLPGLLMMCWSLWLVFRSGHNEARDV